MNVRAKAATFLVAAMILTAVTAYSFPTARAAAQVPTGQQAAGAPAGRGGIALLDFPRRQFLGCQRIRTEAPYFRTGFPASPVCEAA